MRVTSGGRAAAAEAVGTALLLAVVVGSGIMAQRLTVDTAVALLASALATGAGLVAIILTFAPISGAHLNPAVSLAEAARGALPWRRVPAYIGAQVIGALAGVIAAHAMFAAPLLEVGQRARSGWSQGLSEAIATFGLVAVIRGCSRARPGAVPFAVACYITSAYWFTASTSFANPAVTLARSFTDTFAGIRPVDVPPFVAAQLLGAGAAVALFRWLAPPDTDDVRAIARPGDAEEAS
jgi:glycerol uptake facilitator-like aquaporin